jgi:hypothetical protein
MKNVKQYYKELGRLVYAVAIADGSIQHEERSELRQFVSKQLASHEQRSDSSGMNVAFYVDFEFDESESDHLNVNEAIRSYLRFLGANHEPGDEALISRSVALLESVANAYRHKKEKDIIDVVKEQAAGLFNKKKNNE